MPTRLSPIASTAALLLAALLVATGAVLPQEGSSRRAPRGGASIYPAAPAGFPPPLGG